MPINHPRGISLMRTSLLRRWHRLLDLPRQSSPSWYRDRLREELRELRVATTPLQKLSETSDVFFSVSRACYELPPFHASRHSLVYGYMLVKFTSRWCFYQATALFCGAPRYDTVREVVNPAKDRNLEIVAARHRIDPMSFRRVGSRLRRVWPLLP